MALLPAAQDAVVEAAYQAYLLANGLVGNAGIAVGQQAAACIVTLRANDGSFPVPSPTFFGGTNPGQWRPTTPNSTTSMVSPWFGGVVPFTLKNSAQLLPAPGPPALTSGLYTRDYNEVKEVGAKFSTVRTPEQTDLAHFYSDNFVALWYRTLRTIADTYVTDLGDSARLFALATLAAADAGISAWHAKLYWNFWRPITAIREGANDGNSTTSGDPLWEPLITTPNYPDYTSGANNLTSSMARVLKHFFGTDQVTFTIESKAPLAIVKFRTYERFPTADWAYSHFLRPLH